MDNNYLGQTLTCSHPHLVPSIVSQPIGFENLAIDFYSLLKERFDNNVYTTERNVTYTFFATMVMFGYYKPHEILLEYRHPNIKGYKKIDTFIQPNDKKNGLVMECKYDREMPSGHNGPRPQKAGKIFNDFFRLASFTNDVNVRKWLIYLTDEEMVNYYNNVNNKLNDFFNLATGTILIIDDEYLKNKSQTFNGGIDTNGISEINIRCVFQNDLPNNHKIKIYEVEIPNDVVFPNYGVDSNQSNIYIKHKEKDNIEKSVQIKHPNVSRSQDGIIKETSMNNDSINNLWKNMVLKLYSKPKEIQTMGRGLWFSAHSKDDSIYIDNSQTNKSSVELNGTRKIDEKEFSKVYPYYQPWRKGEVSRKFMQRLSLNTSYILALINHFGEDNHRGLT